MCSNCHKTAGARRRKAFFSARLSPASAAGRPHTLALCKHCLGEFVVRHRPALHLNPARRIRLVLGGTRVARAATRGGWSAREKLDGG
jgi:hypothetical protein